MTNKKAKQAYQDILGVCDKYIDLSEDNSRSFGDIKDMWSKAKNHLLIIEWSEKYGIELGHEMSDHITFNHYDDAKKEHEQGSGRFISWSDDGTQPKDEWLMSISFGTGAYIFGRDYDGQKRLFRDFFAELKTYNPDFIDSANKSLYWRLENAKDIYTSFNEIIKKYRDRNGAELQERKVQKLKEQLEKESKKLEQGRND